MWAHHQYGAPISEDKEYYFLRNYPLEKLASYYESCCILLHNCEYCKIVITITDNKRHYYIREEEIHKMHLRNLMQRMELEIDFKNDNLGHLHFDTSNLNQKIQDTYHNIFSTGDFLTYRHLKDSISIEQSHQSIGIQFADYVAGISNHYFKNSKTGKDYFKKYISPLLRRNETGNSIGWGIINIPTDEKFRLELENKIHEDGLT